MITALLVPLNEEISCFVELNAIAIGGGGDYVRNAYGGAGSRYIERGKIIFSMNSPVMTVQQGGGGWRGDSGSFS